MSQRPRSEGKRPSRRFADESDILNAFRRILKALRLASVQTQAETGISAAQLFVLSQLESGDSLSINELAQATMTDRSSVADVVDRLAERKLIRRTAAPHDRRRAAVRLTPGGRALLRKAPPAPTTLLLEGLRQLNATDLRALTRGLNHLCEELGLAQEQPEMLFEVPRATHRKPVAGRNKAS